MQIELQLVRLKDVLKVIPVSKSTWWDGINKGVYPKPVYVAERVPAWRWTEIQSIIEHGITVRKRSRH